jgi:hypothetical protein
MIIRGYEINNRNEKHKSRKMILDLCHPTRRVKRSRDGACSGLLPAVRIVMTGITIFVFVIANPEG